MAWKHLLLDKLHLPPPGSARLENYDLILEAYESFLKRSNTVDLADVFSMYKQLRPVESDPEEPVSSVRENQTDWTIRFCYQPIYLSNYSCFFFSLEDPAV